jgi:hypothetical protein
MKDKKGLIVGLIIIALIVGSVIYLLSKNKAKDKANTDQNQSSSQASQKPVKKITGKANITPVNENPYVKLNPLRDGHNMEVIVESTKKSSTEAEYELEYQAGSLLQGAFGILDLSSLPSKEKIFFGSCSSGGRCTHHKDIKGGNLAIKLNGDKVMTFKGDWKYFDNLNKITKFSSQDGKFQIEGDAFKKVRFFTIYNTPGYPTEKEYNIVSDLYNLSDIITAKADLKIRSKEDGELIIVGYDGKEFTEYETKVDGKMASAEVDLVELYFVIKK